MEIKKTRKKMYNNGITLIALIITIIVLLILAGVTINLTLGENGVFKTAEMAGKNYTQAQEKELAGLASLENTINNIVGGIDNNEEIKYQTLKEVAVPGDYVKYDTGIAGLGENKDGKLTFIVLYNDETYGLQIISDNDVEDVTFELNTFQTGMESYNNAISVLNQKAEYYATSSPYALDGRCVGSVPTIDEEGKFNAKNTEELGTFIIPDDWTLPEGWTSRDTGCQKWTDENYTTDWNVIKEIIEIRDTGKDYWLASHVVDSSFCRFGIRCVNEYAYLTQNFFSLVKSNGDAYAPEGSRSKGLRPCISLNPDVKVIGGDGSEEIPYELGM